MLLFYSFFILEKFVFSIIVVLNVSRTSAIRGLDFENHNWWLEVIDMARNARTTVCVCWFEMRNGFEDSSLEKNL